MPIHLLCVMCQCKQCNIQFHPFNFRLVTPYSKLEIKVFSQNTFRADTLVGVSTIELHGILLENRGKCKLLNLINILYNVKRDFPFVNYCIDVNHL